MEHGLKSPPLRFSHHASCIPQNPSIKDFVKWLQQEFDHETDWNFLSIISSEKLFFPEKAIEFTHHKAFVGEHGEYIVHLIYSQKCYFASYYSLTHS